MENKYKESQFNDNNIDLQTMGLKGLSLMIGFMTVLVTSGKGSFGREFEKFLIKLKPNKDEVI